MNMEERIEMAVSLFKEGYNCSQSVVAAFADKYGFTREQALKMSASFGGQNPNQGRGRFQEAWCGFPLEMSAVHQLRLNPRSCGRCACFANVL